MRRFSSRENARQADGNWRKPSSGKLVSRSSKNMIFKTLEAETTSDTARRGEFPPTRRHVPRFSQLELKTPRRSRNNSCYGHQIEDSRDQGERKTTGSSPFSSPREDLTRDLASTRASRICFNDSVYSVIPGELDYIYSRTCEFKCTGWAESP